MAIKKKTLFPINLETWPTFIVDDLDTSRYFKVTELPDTFNGGKNGFKIQGSDYLAPDTTIEIEIKDSSGNVIYHEPVKTKPQYYEGTNIVVSVIIYPETTFGPCTITIMGILKTYDKNGFKTNIPTNWAGFHNVRWQKRVNVQPYHPNTSRIRFYKRPTVEIVEQSVPLYTKSTQNYTYNTYFTTLQVNEAKTQVPPVPSYYYSYLTDCINNGTIKITSKGAFYNDYPPPTLKFGAYYQIYSYGAQDSDFTSIGGPYVYGTNFVGTVFKTTATDVLGGATDWPDDAAILQEVFLSGSGLNDIVYTGEFVNPSGFPIMYEDPYPDIDVPVDLYNPDILSELTYYTASIVINNARNSSGYLTGDGGLPNTFSTTIKKWEAYTTIDGTYQRLYLKDPFVAPRRSYVIDPINISEIIASYTKPIYFQSGVSQSYAKIKIKNLETFTGDVYKLKVYAKSRNNLQGYQLLEDLRLEANEFLLADNYLGKLNVRTGIFSDSIVVRDYWTKTPITYNGVTTSIISSTNNGDSFYSQSVRLELDTDWTTKTTGVAKFETKDKFQLQKNQQYNVSYKLICKAAPYGIAGLDVYMSGSAFNNDSLTLKQGQKVTSYDFTKTRVLDKQSFNFLTDNDGSGSLCFLIRNGNWEISDVSLNTSQETAFSPPEFTFRSDPHQTVPNETFDFKFEFYDINYALAPITVEAPYTFSGGNNISKYFILRYDSEPAVSLFTVENTSGGTPGVDIDSNYSYLGVRWVNGNTIGNISFVSSAYDEAGAYILPTQIKSGYPYPGGLTYISDTQKRLTFDNFTSSLTTPSRRVGKIIYTASLDSIQQFFSFSADYSNAKFATIPQIASASVFYIASNAISASLTLISTGSATIISGGFLVGTNATPTTSSYFARATASAAPPTGSAISASIKGLSAGTTYYYRGYASNAYGTVYTDSVLFNTLPNSGSVSIKFDSTIAAYNPRIQSITYRPTGSTSTPIPLALKNLTTGTLYGYPLSGSVGTGSYSASYAYEVFITASHGAFPKGFGGYLDFETVDKASNLGERALYGYIPTGTGSFTATITTPSDTGSYLRLTYIRDAIRLE
jgi:hypothetical protein